MFFLHALVHVNEVEANQGVHLLENVFATFLLDVFHLAIERLLERILWCQGEQHNV